MPGGAAGLQNWRVIFGIVDQRRAFSNKPRFFRLSADLIPFHIFHSCVKARFWRPIGNRIGNKDLVLTGSRALLVSNLVTAYTASDGAALDECP